MVADIVGLGMLTTWAPPGSVTGPARVIEPATKVVLVLSNIGVPLKVVAFTMVDEAPDANTDVPLPTVSAPVPTGPLASSVVFAPKPAETSVVMFVLPTSTIPPAVPPIDVPPP